MTALRSPRSNSARYETIETARIQMPHCRDPRCRTTNGARKNGTTMLMAVAAQFITTLTANRFRVPGLFVKDTSQCRLRWLASLKYREYSVNDASDKPF